MINPSLKEWFELNPSGRHGRILSLKVLGNMRRGKSLRMASLEFGINPETAKRHIRSAIVKRHGRWIARRLDKIERCMNIYERGRIKSIRVTNSEDASIIGHYYNDVKKALETGDASVLRKYRGKILTDSEGKKHRLETKLDKIRDIEDSKEEPEFYEIYEE